MRDSKLIFKYEATQFLFLLCRWLEDMFSLVSDFSP